MPHELIHPDLYLIADACRNHAGKVTAARMMIKIAADAGCDAIKFQYRTEDKRRPGDFDLTVLDNLAELADDSKIDFLCTAYSIDGFEEMIRVLDLPIHKIGSAQNYDNDFIKRVLAEGKPTLLSTGGMDDRSVYNTKSWISRKEEYKRQAVLLHCVSEYPTPYEHVNLRSMEFSRFWTKPFGFSDHTPTAYTSFGAAALGATYIEKHFTLDRSLAGPDQVLSLEPRELREWINGCRIVAAARGGAKSIYTAEIEKLRTCQ